MLRKRSMQAVYLKAKKYKVHGEKQELGLFFQALELYIKITLPRCSLRSEIYPPSIFHLIKLLNSYIFGIL